MCIRDRANIIDDYVNVFDDLSFNNIAQVSNFLMEKFDTKEYDAIDVSYGMFKNAAMQFAQTVQYLPVEKIEISEEEKEQASKIRADYIFEPDKDTLLDQLIPSILQTTFQKFLLDTHASEHGARMTAMDKASENANELSLIHI